MKAQNRNILLILDNAPSHVTSNIELPHLTILFLPPNATSKIQPLDAGIISAFKRHYRHYQLQNAIDLEERGTNKNIYKVDQLQAMNWVRMAWKEISKETIQNCWKHTAIISPRAQDGTILLPEEPNAKDWPLTREESLLEDQLALDLVTLRVRDPMKISNLVNIEAENNTHKILTDSELIEAAVTLEEDRIVTEIDEVEPELPLGRQTEALVDAIRIVTGRCDSETSVGVVRSLRAVLRDIREEQRVDRESHMVQTTLNSFFTQTV